MLRAVFDRTGCSGETHLLPDSPDFLERFALERRNPFENGHCLERDVGEEGVIYPFVSLPSDDSCSGLQGVGGDVLFPGCYESGQLPSDRWIRRIVSVKGDQRVVSASRLDNFRVGRANTAGGNNARSRSKTYKSLSFESSFGNDDRFSRRQISRLEGEVDWCA